MVSNKELSTKFINELLKNEKITLVEIADICKCTKGYISNVKRGLSSFSQDKYNLLIKSRPEFAKYGFVNYSQLIFDETKLVKTQHSTNIINIKKRISFNTYNEFINSEIDNNDTFIFDKRIIERYYCLKDDSNLEVIRIPNNSFSPMYSINQYVLVDTSVKSFASGFIFVFYYDNELRINEIRKQGEYIHCVDISKSEHLYNFDAKISECQIVGILIPSIAF